MLALLLLLHLSSCSVILISIDGFKFEYLRDPRAHLPNLRRLASEGTVASKGVTGVTPTLTYPSHTTLITGVDPYEHNITSNTLFDPANVHHSWPNHNGSFEEWYWNYSSISRKTLFRAVKDSGGTTAAVFWPVTVGSEDIDHLVPEIWPSSLVAGLCKGAEAAEAILADVPESVILLGDITRMEIASSIVSLKPDLLAVHLADVDSAQHACGVGCDSVYRKLEQTDVWIGSLQGQLEELGLLSNTTLVITSDHGFANVSTYVYPNAQFRADSRLGDSDWEVYAWVGGGSAGIYVNPEASSNATDYVDALFSDAAIISQWGLESVLPGSEAEALGGWRGAYKILNLKEGYEFHSSPSGPVVGPSHDKAAHGFPRTNPSMKFNLILWGNGIARGSLDRDPLAVQIAPTIARLLGVSLDSAVGKPLIEALVPSIQSLPLVVAAGAAAATVIAAVVATLTILNRRK